MRHIRTLSIFLVFIILSLTPIAHAAKEQRTALVIGNGAYSSSPLKNPVNDATDMAATLKRLGFTVILKKNVTHRPMEEAIKDFGNRLKKKKGVGLFFYAGHGLQINGANYLIPIGAKVDKETDVQFEAVNIERILAEMANAENGLNIVMLDACRDNPFRSLYRSASRGLAMISNAPTGTFISYSTTPNQVARDGSGRNSPYTAAILKQIQEPGLTIEDVFKSVRQKVRKETGQVPWELSSLEGDFYFITGKRTQGTDVTKANEPSHSMDREDKAQKAVAMGKVPQKEEIKSDGRFIAYDDGTVLDTSTNLMWAAEDNGSDIDWKSAKSYCDNYRSGGYKDWRMPMQYEMAALYASGANKGKIKLSMTWVWASETSGSDAAFFDFGNGNSGWFHRSAGYYGRALPVRYAK